MLFSNKMKSTTKIIIYDGVCGFCNHWVQFILDHKPNPNIQFVSFQSPLSKPYRQKYGITTMNTILLIEDEKCYRQSTAVLKVLRLLDTRWKYGYYLIYIPKYIRDLGYDIISKNRYLLMGKNQSCRLLTPQEKQFFME